MTNATNTTSTSEIYYCPGCLKRAEKTDNCGSQRCPPFELTTKSELLGMIHERRNYDQMIKNVSKLFCERKQKEKVIGQPFDNMC